MLVSVLKEKYGVLGVTVKMKWGVKGGLSGLSLTEIQPWAVEVSSGQHVGACVCACVGERGAGGVGELQNWGAF